eukprot:SAG25_NODE_393_length_8567_cov_15.363368_3_plen_192_part_00
MPLMRLTEAQVLHLRRLFRSVVEEEGAPHNAADVEAAAAQRGEQVEFNQAQMHKLLRKTGLCQSTADAADFLHEMDKDQNGTVSMVEFIRAVDEAVESRDMTVDDIPTKFGYGGSKWRDHADIAWITSSLTIVIAVGVVFYLLVSRVPALRPLPWHASPPTPTPSPSLLHLLLLLLPPLSLPPPTRHARCM